LKQLLQNDTTHTLLFLYLPGLFDGVVGSVSAPSVGGSTPGRVKLNTEKWTPVAS